MRIGVVRSARAWGGQGGAPRLGFGWGGGRTVLVVRRASAPFGVVRANYPDGSGMPEGQITNPSGGILGGNRLQVRVHLESRSRATVLTQVANKAYGGEEAPQTTVLCVGGGALLEYLPHRLIPYVGPNYRQERFAFDRPRARTSVFRDGVPEAIGALDLAGGEECFGGYSYTATAHVLAPEGLGPLADEPHGFVVGVPGVLASASAVAPGFCAVRILTHKAPKPYGARDGIRTLVRKSFGLPAPARDVV